MKVAILGERNNWHAKTLQEAFLKMGVQCDVFSINSIVANVSQKPIAAANSVVVDEYEVLIVRSLPPGSLEQVIFRMDLLHRLENQGIRIINSPDSLEKCVDKFYTSFLLEEHGIPTPRTIITERFDKAMEAFLYLKDIVVKPLFGSEGKGMLRIQDEEIAYRVFKALERERMVFYIQEFIPHFNRDFRVFTIQEEPVGAIIRFSENWKTNLAAGGKAIPLQMSQEIGNLSKKASMALKTFYAGIDILKSEDGRLLVTEINAVPGWKGLFEATGIDIPTYLAGRILESL
ncbi:MAG: RimK family alpha-L-glutamate ligase [Caldiserica bacterium]|jgi:ribosomal protein S6--L-glutamate ligase/tetrahydromethanopterin:alpha-L-glutamate ligase|nr:RimK family alpha-L-glutamate ligase [Caldisericota bacterium]